MLNANLNGTLRTGVLLASSLLSVSVDNIDASRKTLNGVCLRDG
jgi:hypothetical protein